jgi:hypothetical protein
MINRFIFLWFCLKILFVWGGVSVLIICFGDYLLISLHALFQVVIKLMVAEFLPKISIVDVGGISLLQLEVWVMKAIHITNSVVIPKGVVLTASTHVMHTLLPIGMLFSILLVWPVRSGLERFILLAECVVFSVVILLLTVPVLLLAVLEMPFQEAAQSANSLYQPPWFMDWMVFCEMGGSVLLEVIAGFLCIWLKDKLTAVSFLARYLS